MKQTLHPRLQGVRVPRIRLGHGIRGPDCHGCINSGWEPYIYRGYDGYYVGYHLEVLEFLRDRRRAEAQNKPLPTRRLRDGKGRITAQFFKSRQAACKAFLRLISDRLHENDAVEEQYRKALEKAQSRDPETAIQGALELSDFC